MHEVDSDGQCVWRWRPRQSIRHGIRVEHVAVGPVGHLQQRRRRWRWTTAAPVHLANAAHDGMRPRWPCAPARHQAFARARLEHVLRTHGPPSVGRRQLLAAIRQGRVSVQRQEDQGPGENQNGIHREQVATVHDVFEEENWNNEEG